MIKKIFSIFLPVILMLLILPTSSYAMSFSDIPDNWSKEGLEKAVENGLLYGSDGQILPENNLTRAQMAAIINRAFGATEKANLSGYADIDMQQWYAGDLAIAVKMGTLLGDGQYMYPEDEITREQAYAVLARAFKLHGGGRNTFSNITDASSVSEWAVKDVSALFVGGYLKGLPDTSQSILDPQKPITRAEFAHVMNNLVKEYYTQQDTYSNETIKGSLVVNTPGVVLENMTIEGNLIVGDGVGKGELTLNNVKVHGTTIVRGGGKNSIIITGESSIPNMIVSKVNGVVSVKALGGAEVNVVYIDDGCDDVIITGNVKNLNIGEGVNVTAVDATINNVNINGSESTFTVDEKSSVNNLTVAKSAYNTTLNIDGRVNNLKVNGNDTKINVTGVVEKLNVHENAKGTKLKINSGGRVEKLETDEKNIEIENSGTITSAPAKENTRPSTGSSSSGSSGSYYPSATPTPTPEDPDDPNALYKVMLDTSYPEGLVVTIQDNELIAGDTVNVTITGVPEGKCVSAWLQKATDVTVWKNFYSRQIGINHYYFTDMPKYDVIVKVALNNIGDGSGEYGLTVGRLENTENNVYANINYHNPLKEGDDVYVSFNNIPKNKKIDSFIIQNLAGEDYRATTASESALEIVGDDLTNGAGRKFKMAGENLLVGVNLKDVLINITTHYGQNTARKGDTIVFNTSTSSNENLTYEWKIEGFVGVPTHNNVGAYTCLEPIELQPDTILLTSGTAITSSGAIEITPDKVGLQISPNEAKDIVIRVTATATYDGITGVEEYSTDSIKIYVTENYMYPVGFDKTGDMDNALSYYLQHNYNYGLYEKGKPVTITMQDNYSNNYRITDVLVYKKGDEKTPVVVTKAVIPSSVCFAEIEFNMPNFEVVIKPIVTKVGN